MIFLKGARQPPVRPPSSRRTLWCRAERTARRSKNHSKFTFPLWENCFRFRNYRFDVEVEHFLHVGRNWRQNGVTTPVIACVCHDDRPDRRRDCNRFPRNGKFLNNEDSGEMFLIFIEVFGEPSCKHLVQSTFRCSCVQRLKCADASKVNWRPKQATESTTQKRCNLGCFNFVQCFIHSCTSKCVERTIYVEDKRPPVVKINRTDEAGKKRRSHSPKHRSWK